MAIGDPFPAGTHPHLGYVGWLVSECWCDSPMIQYGHNTRTCTLCGLPERFPTMSEQAELRERHGLPKPGWVFPEVVEIEHPMVGVLRQCAQAFDQLADAFMHEPGLSPEAKTKHEVSAGSLQYASGFIRDRLAEHGYSAFAP